MLSLLDIAERMQKGPKIDENAWNMGLFRKMNELTERYQLFYPEDGPVFNLDDGMADRAFRAAIDFLVETGIYCITKFDWRRPSHSRQRNRTYARHQRGRDRSSRHLA